MDDNDRTLTAFTMLGHGTFHSYELAIPVFVVIWLDAFPVTSASLGLVVGISYALVGFGAIPSGVLADRFGSRRVILACLMGMGGAFFLLSLSPNIAVLALALILWGSAGSLYHPAALALISRGAKRREVAFAYHGVAGNVGVATGPLFAAVLLLFFHWRVVAALLVVPTVVAVLLGRYLSFDERAGDGRTQPSERDDGDLDGARANPLEDGGTDDVPESRNPRSQPRTLSAFLEDSRQLLTGGFLGILAIGMLYGAYYRGLFTFLPDVLADLPVFAPTDRFGATIEPSQYVYSGLLLLGALGQYAGGRVVERIPVERALVGTYVSLAVVALLFVPALEASLGPLLAVTGLLGFLAFMAAPINQEAIAKYSSPSMRGLSFGYTYTAIFGLGAFGATLAGLVLSWWSPHVLFALLAGIATLGVAFALALARPH
jgi:MFS family permease